MDVKITDEKLDKLKDIVIDFLGVDKNSFQSRQSWLTYIEFLTPGTRSDVVARYYPNSNFVEVNEDKFYGLVSSFVSSKKIYDLIKNDLIRRIYYRYTSGYKSIFKEKIKKFIFSSDEEFQKKKYH